MPAPPRPITPDRGRADQVEDDASWGSFQAAVLQAIQEQHQLMHEACSRRDEEQLRRLETLTSSLLGEFGERLKADFQEVPSRTTVHHSRSTVHHSRTGLEANRSLANTLQETLCDAGIVPIEVPAQDEERDATAREARQEETNPAALPSASAADSRDSSNQQSETARKASFASASSARQTMGLKDQGNNVNNDAHITQIREGQKELKGTKRKGLTKVEVNKSNRLQVLADSGIFKTSCAFLILANSLFIGFEVDTSMYSALQRPPIENPEWFKAVNRCFLVAFLLELVIRISAFRLEFFLTPDWSWNVFDVMMVLSSVIEELMEGMEGMNMSSVRVLRVFRLIRTFRIIRVVNVFRSLRLMVCCIFNSLLSLLWALMLLLLTMYLFSIVCVQGASSHLYDLGLAPLEVENMTSVLGDALAEASWSSDVVNSHELGIAVGLDSGDDLSGEQMWSQIELQYRSVVRALMTLLMCIAGGVDWYEAVRPLMSISPVYTILFCAYIVFVLFGVLNVLSAVFVEQALQIRDRDLLVQAEMERTREFMKDMSELFKEADGDGSGILTRDEMDEYLKNERVAMYMSTQQLDVSDVNLMFRMLDADGTGEVEMDEFALGCFRLKGHARCLDVIRINEGIDNLHNEINLTRASIETINEAMAGGLDSNARSQIRSSDQAAAGSQGSQCSGQRNPARGLSGDAAAGEALNGPPSVS